MFQHFIKSPKLLIVDGNHSTLEELVPVYEEPNLLGLAPTGHLDQRRAVGGGRAAVGGHGVVTPHHRGRRVAYAHFFHLRAGGPKLCLERGGDGCAARVGFTGVGFTTEVTAGQGAGRGAAHGVRHGGDHQRVCQCVAQGFGGVVARA